MSSDSLKPTLAGSPGDDCHWVPFIPSHASCSNVLRLVLLKFHLLPSGFHSPSKSTLESGMLGFLWNPGAYTALFLSGEQGLPHPGLLSSPGPGSCRKEAWIDASSPWKAVSSKGVPSATAATQGLGVAGYPVGYVSLHGNCTHRPSEIHGGLNLWFHPLTGE